VSGFASAEISFTYADDSTGTWFLIASSDQPVTDGTLTTWDTTILTDGDYVLRLRVSLADGSYQDIVVLGLRVRNYTAAETATPLALSSQVAPTLIFTPTVTLIPTPTSLPQNPAAISVDEVSQSVLYGGVAAIIGFLIFGLYLWQRRK
jgi:hypothetical protein